MASEDKNNDYSHLSSKAQEDIRLIESAKSGNQMAYETLLKKYKNSLYGSIYKIVRNQEIAEDLTLETFGKVFSKLDQYNYQYAFSTWLFNSGVHGAIDYLRKKKQQNITSIDEYIDNSSDKTFSSFITSPHDDPIHELLKQEKINFIRLIIERLKPKYKQVIQLYYYQELSCDEIAKSLNISTGTVKADLFRARMILYQIIIDSKRDTK